MNCLIDLTGDRILDADFTEAVFALPMPLELGATLSLQVWGVAVPANLVESSRAGDLYVADFSTLTFDRVIGVDLTVYPYDPTMPTKFCTDQMGGRLTFHRRWGQQDGYIYPFEGRLAWPYGGCVMQVAAKGRAELQVRRASAILVTEYALNPNRYGWPG